LYGGPPGSPPTPIDTLFQQLEDGIYFAAASQEPLFDTAVAHLGYNFIVKTGLFIDACRVCMFEPEAQTFAESQTPFCKMGITIVVY
jgi:hypothetical protein